MLGGGIADSHDKALIARRLKFEEIFLQMTAAGFVFASPAALYLAPFGLGVIAALFKYGILDGIPQLGSGKTN
jgi:acyl-[acyl-carrier-protein]-phospholipid O-acyltransferase/long-chain-fatty-acid--[acyl-carrier-protein] ligase